jgi:hypothetical protein
MRPGSRWAGARVLPERWRRVVDVLASPIVPAPTQTGRVAVLVDAAVARLLRRAGLPAGHP